MELMSGHVIRLVTLCMVAAFVVDHVHGACSRATGVQDILDAAHLSLEIYNTNFKRGSKIPDAPGWVVDKVIKSQMMNQPLRVVIAIKPGQTMICFMGTKTPAQLAQQFLSGLKREWTTLRYPGNMRVMKYYKDAMDKLDVVKIVSDLYLRKGSGMKYIVTGHSLGGALSSLFAVQMANEKKGNFWSENPKSVLITFGAPRTGNGAYQRMHDQLLPPYRKLRFVYNKDAAPHVPLKILGFLHASREIWIEQIYKRKLTFRTCGWYRCCKCPTYSRVKNYVKFHVCRRPDAIVCDNPKQAVTRLGRFNVLDHNMLKYIPALEELKTDGGILNKFLNDQC